MTGFETNFRLPDLCVHVAFKCWYNPGSSEFSYLFPTKLLDEVAKTFFCEKNNILAYLDPDTYIRTAYVNLT